MKRREFLKAAGVGIATSTIAAPAIAQSMPELRWRLTASWPKSLDTLYGAPEYMAKRIAELSENKFHIQVFAAGEIVPGLQVLDAVQNGTVEMGHTASYYYFGKDPAFTFGTALPFGLNTRQQEAWQFQGGGMELLNDFFKTYNCWGTTPSFCKVLPAHPPIRNLRPLRSSTVLISLRNQPPICAPVLPPTIACTLNFLANSFISLRPSPS